MSIKIIEKQLERFLKQDIPEVIAINGAWGVGKTYAWNSYLSVAKHRKQIALNNYSYVSLFGLNSLKDLKFAIFENMISLDKPGRRSSVASFKQNVSDLLGKLGKTSVPFVSNKGLAGHYHSMLDSLSFLALDKTIICIDDFERKGKSLETQDILGLITQLKEQKKCKVVLILNDESLRDESALDYVRLREKVIDTELKFAPTAEDCAQIALQEDKTSQQLSENIIKLKINNIRIIKKIEKLAALLLPQLEKYDEKVTQRALYSLPLLAWCYYGQSSEVPDYGFVINRKRMFANPADEINLTTQQQEWCSILRAYGDFSVEGFDLQVARLVENGYLEEKGLHEEAQLLNDKLAAERSENSFQEAWLKFNDSFDDNAKEVIDCLAKSFQNNARFISPANLDGAVQLLRYLGKNILASSIIDTYIKKRGDERELFNLDSAEMANDIKDQEVIEKFKTVQKELRSKSSVLDICDRLLALAEQGDEEMERQLAQVSVTEFIDFFKQQKGPALSQYIDLCLKFGRMGGMTDYQSEISSRAETALQRIGAESKLNASRVQRFGIKVK